MPDNRIRRYPNQGAIAVLSTDTAQQVGVSPQDVDYTPVRGMIRNKPTTQLVAGEAWTVKNLYWKDGAYRTRPGASAIGGLLADPVCGVVIYTNSSLGDYFIVAQPEGFSYYDGSTWTALTGATLGGDVDTMYSFTQWGSSLIYANGVDSIGAVSVSGWTYAALSGAPVANTVMNFAKRVVAFGISGNPSRVQWCVSGNNGDWSGTGSGYEDLQAAPGGVVDDALCGVPLTDDTAILIRRRSIWTMTRSGYFDAPFTFSRRFQTQGTESPHSFELTPIGIIGLFLDDVYVFTDSELPRAIGTPVRNAILNGADLPRAVATYDRFLQEYRLFVPKKTRDGTSVVWRYSIKDNRWTYDEFPFDVVDITAEYYTLDPIVDNTDDVIDSVDVPVDSFTGVPTSSGLILGQYDTTGQVVCQLLDGNTDDVGQGSVTSDQPIDVEVQLGELTPGSMLRRANLIEIITEAFSGSAVVILAEYSTDGGSTWTTYDQLTCGPDGSPTIYRFTKYLESKRLTVRLTSSDAAGYVIDSLVLRTNVGSKHAH